MSTASEFEAGVLKAQKEPYRFFEGTLGVDTLQPYQYKFIQAVADYDRVCVRATHSISKTWTMGRIALWFLQCFYESIVITTAPTHRQVETLLWGEIRDAHKKSTYPLGGHLTQTALKHSDKWYALGFSPEKKAGTSKEQQGSSFQGFHSKYVMIIFDEATGVPADVYAMAEGLTTSGYIVKWVCIGNPTTRACEFFKLFSDPAWYDIHLSCFDSPNLIANGLTSKHKLQRELDRLKGMSKGARLKRIEQYKKPVPYLLTCQWVMAAALKWGIDHPLFVSKALGEFPDDSDDVVVPWSIVQAAQDREINEGNHRYIGVDVARYGEDATVITEFRGKKQVGYKELRKRSTPHVTGEVINWLNTDLATPATVVIDETGIGGAVVDNLEDAQRIDTIGRHVEIHGVHFGAAPTPHKDNPTKREKKQAEEDRKNYQNLKAKIFWLLRDDLRDHLDILDDEVYLSQLTNILYKYTSEGKI